MSILCLLFIHVTESNSEYSHQSSLHPLQHDFSLPEASFLTYISKNGSIGGPALNHQKPYKHPSLLAVPSGNIRTRQDWMAKQYEVVCEAQPKLEIVSVFS